MPKQLVVRLNDDDEKALAAIKEKYGVIHDSEAVRIAFKKSLETEVVAR